MVICTFSQTPGTRPTESRRIGLVRRGAAVAEFAVVASVFIILAVGAIEIARAIMVKQVLSDAARCACRTGSQPEASNAAIIQDVNTTLANNNINSTGATITILVNGVAVDASTATQNAQISVQVSIPYANVMWVTSIFMGTKSVESETVVMMRNGT
jgi:Flp pilus assembly protein TadG